MKICACKTCNQPNPQPTSNFCNNKRNKDGLSNRCKDCTRKAIQESNKKNRIKRNMQMREWRKKNPERANRIKRKYIEKNRDKYSLRQRNTMYKMRYGISLEDYEKMAKSQNNKCAICGSEKDCGRGKLSVDHNHKTKKIRGLLCNPCNLMIGYARENIDNLLSAISYLSKHKGGEDAETIT